MHTSEPVVDRVLGQDERVRNWIIYNLGMDPFRVSQLCAQKSTWIQLTNRNWHDDTTSEVDYVIRELLEQKIIKIVEGSKDLLELSEVGAGQWEEKFKPNYELSYSWELSASRRKMFDYKVTICVRRMESAILLLLGDINSGLYGIVDTKRLIIKQQINFKPRYWCKPLLGTMVKYDAIRIARDPHSLTNAFKFRDLFWKPQWHQGLED